MRKVQLSPSDAMETDFCAVDWKVDPEEVFKAIDGLLQEYGLEIVMYEDGSDAFVFGIDTIKKG